MNKWQKNVLGNRAEADERILKRLKKTYQQAEKDIDDNIAALMGRTDAKNLQSITYQIEYQKALKSQISSILEGLNSNQFTDISQYLAESYEDGFVGVIYDLQGQGIPLIFPIDQEQVVRSLKNNSKLSKGLWGSLSHGNSKLQNNLRSEISRGFSQGHSYAQIARSISNQMDIGFNKVSRIVRTESHRISNEAAMDAMHKAKDVGADVVKQWDSTLINGQDLITRSSMGRSGSLTSRLRLPGTQLCIRAVLAAHLRISIAGAQFCSARDGQLMTKTIPLLSGTV